MLTSETLISQISAVAYFNTLKKDHKVRIVYGFL